MVHTSEVMAFTYADNVLGKRQKTLDSKNSINYDKEMEKI
jgi:hypothetical protein